MGTSARTLSTAIIPRALAAAVAAGLLTLSGLAWAQSGIWTGTASGNWSDTNNWTDGVVADGSGNTADFNSIDITTDLAVHLDSARTNGYLIFGDVAVNTSAGWVLDNNNNVANVLTLAGETPTITVNNIGTNTLITAPKSIVVSNVVAGFSGLTKAGSGRLKLTGANTYTGGTVISGGRLSIVAENGLGAVPGSFQTNNITLTNGATLELTALLDVDNQGSSVTLNANRGIVLCAGVQILQRNHRGQNFIINGIISGPGSLCFNGDLGGDGDQGGGSGFDINGANTYSGDTYLGWASGQYKGYAYRINNTLALQNSTLNYINYFGFSESLNRENLVTLPANCVLGGLAGGVNAGQTKSLTVPGKMSVGNNNKDTTYSGYLIGGGSLIKIGTGKLTLGTNNTYSGGTTIAGGTLKISADGNLGAPGSGLVITNAGTLDLGSGCVGPTRSVAVINGTNFIAGAGSITVTNILFSNTTATICCAFTNNGAMKIVDSAINFSNNCWLGEGSSVTWCLNAVQSLITVTNGTLYLPTRLTFNASNAVPLNSRTEVLLLNAANNGIAGSPAQWTVVPEPYQVVHKGNSLVLTIIPDGTIVIVR